MKTFFVPDPCNFHAGEPIEVVLATKARELESANAKLRERLVKAEELLRDSAEALESEIGAEQEAQWNKICAYFNLPT